MTVLTFVIPAYNAAATVKATLQSLTAQKRSDWVALVVDDGSVDDTATIVEAHAAADNRIQLVRVANGGVCRARNHGLALATTEWVTFLDSDDWVGPDYVLEMLAAATANVDVVFCSYARVPPDGPQTTEPLQKMVEAAPFVRVAAGCPFAIHCVAARRSILNLVGGFDQELEACEDWDLWQKVARVGGRFRGVDKVLAFYRMSAGSLSTNWGRMLRDGLVVLRRGHGHDPRIRDPRPEFADGADPSRVALHTTLFALWCGAAASGAGNDGASLLSSVPGPHPVAGNEESFADAMVAGWAVGARRPRSEMAAAYAADRPRFSALIGAVVADLPQKGWALSVASAVEALLLAEGPMETHPGLGLVAKATWDLRRRERLVSPQGADRLLIQLSAGKRRIGVLNIAALGMVNPSESLQLALEQLGWVRLHYRAGTIVDLGVLGDGMCRPIRRALGSLKVTRSYLWLRSITSAGARRMRKLTGRRRTGVPPPTAVGGSASEVLAGTEVRAWEDIFASPDPWRYESAYEQEKYRLTLDLVPDGVETAVELACAEGLFTLALAGRVGTLIATDISHRAVDRAAKRCSDLRSVTFQQFDVLTGQIPAGQQLITASEFLYYLGGMRQLDAVARKIRDALVPGGYLVMANHMLLRDDKARTGFDWDQDYGGKVIHERFCATPGFALDTSIVTELYRIDRFRRLSDGEAAPRPRIVERQVEAALEPSVERYLVRGGATARRREVEFERTWRLPVLAYHRIADEGPEGLAKWRVSKDNFRAQLRWLRANGYHSVTSEALVHCRRRQQPLRGRPIMITFDDGYQDFADSAWPLLEASDFSAEVFIVSDLVGMSSSWDAFAGPPAPLMGWSTIEDLAGKGVRFGSHLATHTPAPNLTSVALMDELVRSRELLQRRAHVTVQSLAAPYGAVDLRLTQLARRAGYEIAYSTNVGVADLRHSSFAAPRVEVAGQWTLADFVATLSALTGATGRRGRRP